MSGDATMRVVVTGGAGFIGSHVVDALLAEGHEVLVVDDLSSGVAGNVPAGVTLASLSVLDPDFADAVGPFAADAVIHLAAQTSVVSSVEDPERDRLINVEGTRAVARAAVAAGARRVLFASTAAVYGEPQELPLQETSPTVPANPYGLSKLTAESVLEDELRGIADFGSLRLANVYGPRQNAQGEGGVVAVFSDKLVAGEPITVFGDGSQTRDFVYVGDVVAAFMCALAVDTDLASRGADGPAYNVSTGVETSIAHVSELIAHAAGAAVEVRNEPMGPGDVDRSSLDPRKAQRIFGWAAATPLEEGLPLTVDWFGTR